MQMYGKLEGFLYHSALFGLVNIMTLVWGMTSFLQACSSSHNHGSGKWVFAT